MRLLAATIISVLLSVFVSGSQAAAECDQGCHGESPRCFGVRLTDFRCTGEPSPTGTSDIGYLVDPVKVIEASESELPGECKRVLLRAAAASAKRNKNLSKADIAAIKLWSEFAGDYGSCKAGSDFSDKHLQGDLNRILSHQKFDPASKAELRKAYCKGSDDFAKVCGQQGGKMINGPVSVKGKVTLKNPKHIFQTPGNPQLCELDGMLIDPSCFIDGSDLSTLRKAIGISQKKSSCLQGVLGPANKPFVDEFRYAMGDRSVSPPAARGSSDDDRRRTQSSMYPSQASNQRILCCGQCVSVTPGTKQGELKQCGVTGPDNMNIIQLSDAALKGDKRCAVDNDYEVNNPKPDPASVAAGVLSHEMLHSLGICSESNHSRNRHDPIYSCTQQCFGAPAPYKPQKLISDTAMVRRLEDTKNWERSEWMVAKTLQLVLTDASGAKASGLSPTTEADFPKNKQYMKWLEEIFPDAAKRAGLLSSGKLGAYLADLVTSWEADPDTTPEHMPTLREKFSLLTGNSKKTLTVITPGNASCAAYIQCAECNAGLAIAKTGNQFSGQSSILSTVNKHWDEYKQTPACASAWKKYEAAAKGGTEETLCTSKGKPLH